MNRFLEAGTLKRSRKLGLVWLVCLVLGCARLQAVSYSGRYVGHNDERHLFTTAVTVIHGDSNPHFFDYPSLPIYLTALSMKASLMLFPAEGAGPNDKLDAPKRAGQRYHPSTPFEHARLAFGALAAALFFVVALLGWQITGNWLATCLAPLILSVDPWVQRQSVGYQNVDLPSTLFSLGAIASALVAWRRPSLLARAVIPGVLCGLAVASKYNSGLVVLSCQLAILLSPITKQRWLAAAILGASATAAFFITVPYSLLDFEHFRSDVLYEIHHYKNGHPGMDGEPGVPQLLYYLQNIEDAYGGWLCAVSLIGIFWGLRKRTRPMLVVLLFPVLMLLHMSTNRVHFLRTILPVFALVSVFVSVGAYAIFDSLRGISRRYLVTTRPSVIHCGVSLFLICSFGAVAWTHPGAAHFLDRDIQPDTRDQLATWARQHGSPDASYFVAEDLWMPKQDLPGDSNQVIQRGTQQIAKKLHSLSRPAYLIVPRYGKAGLAPSRLRRNKTRRNEYFSSTARFARDANLAQEKLMSQLGASKVKVIPGRFAALETRQGRALSVNSPAIDVFYLSGTARKGNARPRRGG